MRYDTASSSRNAIYSTTLLQGGALSCSAVGLALTNSRLLGNSVGFGGSGGALFLDAMSVANVTGSLLQGNTVASSYARAAQGGAIMAQNGVTLRIASSRLQVNAALRCDQATEGGSSSSSSSSSNGGGGISSSSQTAAYALCMSGSGGALAVLGSSLEATGTVFAGNEAQAGGLDAGSSGGAVDVTDTLDFTGSTEERVAFRRCLFAVNSARGAAAG